MGFIKDFKEFAMRGNVMDLAVGVVIGAAFGKIVTALVEDIIMPVVGFITGSGSKFTDLFVVLKDPKGIHPKSLAEAKAGGVNIFAYGDFIQSIVDFLIIAICIFMVVKLMNRVTRHKETQVAAEKPLPSETEKLLMEIRDELKRK